MKGALAPLAASEGISYSLRFSSALTSDPAWHGPVHWIYYQCRCTCGGPRVRTFRTWPGRALAKLKNWGVRQGSCRLLCSSRGSCLNFLTCFDCHSCPRPQYVGYEMLALAAGVFLLLFCTQKQGCRTNVRTLEPSVSTLMHMREWLTLGAKVVLERSNTSPNPGVRTQR